MNASQMRERKEITNPRISNNDFLILNHLNKLNIKKNSVSKYRL